MRDVKGSVAAAADRVAAALKENLPDDGDRHGLLGDFALLRVWAERAAREYEGPPLSRRKDPTLPLFDSGKDTSLRPRPGETADQTVERVLGAIRGDQDA